MRSGILTDSNRCSPTGWSIDDAPQVMEPEWHAASSLDSSDGRLGMWINDAPIEIRDGIVNPNSRVDLVRWGLVSGVDIGTVGSMTFDAFESRRLSHIGLPGEEPTPEPSGTPTATTLP